MGYKASIGILLICVSILQVSGLICYKCEGIEGCKDTFDKFGAGVSTCTDGTYCIKTKGGQFGDEYVTRGCRSDKPITDTCEQMGSGNYGYESCYCDKDYCNLATTLATAGTIQWLLGTITALYMYIAY